MSAVSRWSWCSTSARCGASLTAARRGLIPALFAACIAGLGVNGKGRAEVPPARAALVRAAKAGVPAAQYELANAYFFGTDGLRSNPAIALRWFRKSVAKKYWKAEYALGAFYQFGLGGLRPNAAIALRWYRKSAAQKYRKAEYALGAFYQDGQDGLRPNSAMALQFFRKSAAQKYRKAEYTLGALYQNGLDGLRPNPALAFQWFRKSAAQKYRWAEFVLGALYQHGQDGLRPSVTQARDWYRKAAAQRLKQAIAALQAMQSPPPAKAAHSALQTAAQSTHTTPAAAVDNEREAQGLQSFWTQYFRASHARVVDFGTPALVRPVGFGK